MAVSRARCPHLGLQGRLDRADTRPHADHCCGATGTVRPLDRRQQAQVCLTATWKQCPLLQPRPAPSVGVLGVECRRVPPIVPQALPPVGNLRPIAPPPTHSSSSGVSPIVWTTALAPLAAAIVAFAWLTWYALDSGSIPEAASALTQARDAAAQRVSAARAVEPQPPEASPSPSSEFIPLRAVETPEAAPSVEPGTAPNDTSADGPAPQPTQEPTPIVTPGPFPPPATAPPSRILAPAIDLDASVTSVGTYLVREGNYLVRYHEVAEYAAGWHEDSALPGAVGNTVLAGHNNTKGEVFRYVVDLEPGDMVYLQAEGRYYPYRVAKKLVLPETNVSAEQQYENARWIAQTDDKRLTLVTCWPYVSNTHRVVVVALPTDTGGAEVARR